MYQVELKNILFNMKPHDTRMLPEIMGMMIDDISPTNAMYQFLEAMQCTFNVDIEDAEVYIDGVLFKNSLYEGSSVDN